MSSSEYHPNVPPPRFMNSDKMERPVSPDDQSSVVSKSPSVHPVVAEPTGGSEIVSESQSQAAVASNELEEASQRNEATDCNVPDTGVAPEVNDGSGEGSVMNYERSDREGDPCICPSHGKPRLMHGVVKPIVGNVNPSKTVEPYDGERNDDEGICHKLTIGFLPFLGWTCCLIAVLWIVTVSSPFLANALTLHGWRFWVSMALALLPSLFVFGVMVCALMRFRKIPRIEQFSEASFADTPDELRDRLIVHYLGQIANPQNYAVENGFVDKGNLTDDVPIVDSLKRLKGEIPSHCSGSDGWLYLFKDFLRMQDERAKEIIAKTWKMVAIKTAASPWKIIDIIAVVYNSTIMVTRLARLYNRRTTRHAAFRLVCRWFINIYIAGEMGDASQGAVEWASANDLISSTYKPLAGLIGKVAEGGANAFLVYRLGRRAMEYFRPLVEVVR